MINKIKNWFVELFKGDLGRDAEIMKDQTLQNAQVAEIVKKRKKKYKKKKKTPLPQTV